MNKFYSSLLSLCLLASIQGAAQSSLNTGNTLTGASGQAGVSFNMSASAASGIVIDSLHVPLYTGTSDQFVEIWYNQNPVSGPPTISTANGWVMVGTVEVNGVNTALVVNPTQYSLPLHTMIYIPAGQKYGFYVGSTGTNLSNVAYSPMVSGGTTTVSDGTLTIHMDSLEGYGGARPNPTFHVRQFLGTVFYSVPPSIPANAGLSWLEASNPCDTATVITARIANYGDNPLTSLTVNWSVNGVPQAPFNYSGSLDTLGANTTWYTTVTLGTISTVSSPSYNITAWSDFPNGSSDPVNYNDTDQINFLNGLNGIYTLGGFNADYYSYGAVVNDLQQRGVCGPTTILVNDSTYTEQVTLTNIPGLTATNTLTFQSASGDSSMSIITSAASTTIATNYTLLLEDVSHINFKGITIENTSGGSYQAPVQVNNTEHVTFENMVFTNTSGTTTSLYASLIYANNGENNFFTVRNSLFDGGSYAMYFNGTSTTDRASKPVVTGNQFFNNYYYGPRFYYTDSLVVRDNIVVRSQSSYSTWYGIYSYYSANADISGNRVIDTTSGTGYGIYLGYNQGAVPIKSVVKNNFVTMGISTGSGNKTGLYLYYAGSVLIANNNIRIDGSGTSSEAIYSDAGGGNRLINNNLVNMGSGYGFYNLSGTNFVESDYNNIYVPNGDVGYYNTAYPTLASWQSAFGTETNSVSVDPGYYSLADLHTCSDSIEGKGIMLAEITTDIDGDPRSSRPDIGADEFVSPNPDLGPDTAFCDGSSVTIGFPATSGTTFLWSTGESTSSIQANVAAPYYVTVSSACGIGSDTINLVSSPQPLAAFNESLNYLTVLLTNTSQNATSYFWNFGDGNTSTDTDPMHLYTTSGVKTITLIATNECGSDTIVKTINIQISGVSESQDGSSVNVFPNPGNGIFNLQGQGLESGIYTIHVTNLQGQIVHQTQENISGSAWNGQIDLSNLASGVYLMKWSGEAASGTVRLVVR